MAQSEILHPSILWAQRKDTIILTVNLNDIKGEHFTLDDTKFTFKGIGGSDQQRYGCELEFFKEVIPQESKHKKTARGLFFVIKKKESGPYWPRLIEQSKKVPFIHTDFNRWRDEDESSEGEDNPYDDTSMNALMQQMGGFGGSGGRSGGPADLGDLSDSSTDSDDEPLPDLEA